MKQSTLILTGVYLLQYLLSNAVSSLLTGIALRFSRYANPYMLGGSAVLCIGGFLLYAATSQSASIPKTVLLSTIPGIGGGISQLLAIGFAQQHVSAGLQPLVLSLTLMVQLLGGTVGVTVGGTVLNS